MRTTMVSCTGWYNSKSNSQHTAVAATQRAVGNPTSSCSLQTDCQRRIRYLWFDARWWSLVVLPIVAQLALPLEVPDVLQTIIGHGRGHISAQHTSPASPPLSSVTNRSSLYDGFWWFLGLQKLIHPCAWMGGNSGACHAELAKPIGQFKFAGVPGVHINHNQRPTGGALQLGKVATHQADKLGKLLVAPADAPAARIVWLIDIYSCTHTAHPMWLQAIKSAKKAELLMQQHRCLSVRNAQVHTSEHTAPDPWHHHSVSPLSPHGSRTPVCHISKGVECFPSIP